jgi:hypothetical protein
MIYDYVRLINNFFIPSQKLISKQRDGGRIVRKLDRPKTPYQRVLESENIELKSKDLLSKVYATINPAEVRREIVRLVQELYKIKDEHEKTQR